MTSRLVLLARLLAECAKTATPPDEPPGEAPAPDSRLANDDRAVAFEGVLDESDDLTREPRTLNEINVLPRIDRVLSFTLHRELTEPE